MVEWKKAGGEETIRMSKVMVGSVGKRLGAATLDEPTLGKLTGPFLEMIFGEAN